MSAVALLQAAADRVVESVAAGTSDLSADARSEAAELAAAIAKDVPGAGADWTRAFPQSPASFDRAANEGADFLTRATPTLARVLAANNGSAAAYAHALADVASAACSLGEPNLDGISRAALAAATQLRAAGVDRPTQAADVHLDAALGAQTFPGTLGPALTVAPALTSAPIATKPNAPPAKSLSMK